MYIHVCTLNRANKNCKACNNNKIDKIDNGN